MPAAECPARGTATGKRIVLTTAGSLRDPHPHLALAPGSRRLGRAAMVATSATDRERVEAGGGLWAVRPAVSAPEAVPALMRGVVAGTGGRSRIVRTWARPARAERDDDPSPAYDASALIVARPLTNAAGLVAETGSPMDRTLSRL